MRMSLATLFDEFCKHFDGKLKWSQKDTEWSNAVFTFFLELNKKENKPFKEEKNYMYIDYIWRDLSLFPYQYIDLALEHENEFEFDSFLNEEMQHLLDIKASNKIAITYPHHGDEKKLVNEIGRRIGNYARKMGFENYLIILGFPTRVTINKSPKLALQFKAYIFDNSGKLIDTKERTILQAS